MSKQEMRTHNCLGCSGPTSLLQSPNPSSQTSETALSERYFRSTRVQSNFISTAFKLVKVISLKPYQILCVCLGILMSLIFKSTVKRSCRTCVQTCWVCRG